MRREGTETVKQARACGGMGHHVVLILFGSKKRVDDRIEIKDSNVNLKSQQWTETQVFMEGKSLGEVNIIWTAPWVTKAAQ